MMTTKNCPACDYPNRADSVICEGCGIVLDGTDQKAGDNIARYGGPAATNPLPADPGDESILTDTGEKAVDTKYLGTTEDINAELGTGKLHVRGNLMLTEQESGARFYIEHDKLQGITIGRADEGIGVKPVVDLTPVGGQERGVSRRHATLTIRDQVLVLIDHHSVNGTFLNGQRLVPDQARVVRDNDMIRVGQVSLKVIYQHD